MAAQPDQFVPRLAAVGGAEDCSILNAGIYSVGIGERWLQMPDALEFPRVLRPIVPLVGREWLAAWRPSVINKLIALDLRHAFGRRGEPAARCLPGFSAVIGTLNHLPEPATGLGRINAV